MNQRREQACNFYREVFPLPLFKTTWVSKDYNRILKKCGIKRVDLAVSCSHLCWQLCDHDLWHSNCSSKTLLTDLTLVLILLFHTEFKVVTNGRCWSQSNFFLTDSTPNADLLFDVTPKTLSQLLHFKTTTTTRWTKNRASSSNCRRGLRKFCRCCGWHALTGAVGPLLPCH